MNQANVMVIPLLRDNYGFVIREGENAVVIDPSESDPVISWLEEQGVVPSHILLTHYHHDHIGGVDSLRRRYKATVVGPVPAPLAVDDIATPDKPIGIRSTEFRVIDTVGHAFPHVSYYDEKHKWLFSGDCLFGAGCGRLAGESASVMWKSIQSLSSLPDDTRLYFGHEYTLSNLEFALFVEPENPDIARRQREVSALLASGRFSAPSTLEEEKRTNPFLRVNSLEIRRSLGIPHASDVEVFAALRIAKNSFRS